MSSYVFLADINKFDAGTTRYRGENALVLADCAKLSYQPETTIKDALINSWKLTNFDFFDGKKTGTQAYIAGNDKVIIVAFRGTEITRIRDLKTDAELKLVDGPAGKVHEGFYKGLKEVWYDQGMSSTLKSYLKKGQSVWFCGHSLGAALATLGAAEYVIKEKGVINGLYTIGQPRTGNAAFAIQFDSALPDRCFRFINNNDVVPRVPVAGLVFKYTHVGHALYFDSKGKLFDSIPWWQKGWDMVKGVMDDVGKVLPDNLKDHGSADYVALLAKNRSVSTQWS